MEQITVFVIETEVPTAFSISKFRSVDLYVGFTTISRKNRAAWSSLILNKKSIPARYINDPTKALRFILEHPRE